MRKYQPAVASRAVKLLAGHLHQIRVQNGCSRLEEPAFKSVPGILTIAVRMLHDASVNSDRGPGTRLWGRVYQEAAVAEPWRLRSLSMGRRQFTEAVDKLRFV